MFYKTSYKSKKSEQILLYFDFLEIESTSMWSRSRTWSPSILEIESWGHVCVWFGNCLQIQEGLSINVVRLRLSYSYFSLSTAQLIYKYLGETKIN